MGFSHGEKVLVRRSNTDKWRFAEFYNYVVSNTQEDNRYCVTELAFYPQCIALLSNEHLLNTAFSEHFNHASLFEFGEKVKVFDDVWRNGVVISSPNFNTEEKIKVKIATDNGKIDFFFPQYVRHCKEV